MDFSSLKAAKSISGRLPSRVNSMGFAISSDSPVEDVVSVTFGSSEQLLGALLKLTAEFSRFNDPAWTPGSMKRLDLERWSTSGGRSMAFIDGSLFRSEELSVGTIFPSASISGSGSPSRYSSHTSSSSYCQ